MTETTWCWSTDEERYHGNCTSEAEAHQEAQDHLDLMPGDTGTYWIGTAKHASEILKPGHVGEWVEEHLDEILADEIGWDDHIVELTPDEKVEVGQMIIDYVKSKNGFRAWGVADAKKHEYTAPERPGK